MRSFSYINSILGMGSFYFRQKPLKQPPLIKIYHVCVRVRKNLNINRRPGFTEWPTTEKLVCFLHFKTLNRLKVANLGTLLRVI